MLVRSINTKSPIRRCARLVWKRRKKHEKSVPIPHRDWGPGQSGDGRGLISWVQRSLGAGQMEMGMALYPGYSVHSGAGQSGDGREIISWIQRSLGGWSECRWTWPYILGTAFIGGLVRVEMGVALYPGHSAH